MAMMMLMMSWAAVITRVVCLYWFESHVNRRHVPEFRMWKELFPASFTSDDDEEEDEDEEDEDASDDDDRCGFVFFTAFNPSSSHFASPVHSLSLHKSVQSQGMTF